jgi:alkanesulfonate monooxygenase SsuD/methylene tetrahydromethanopterin reductase-like flavin-dependent oxidoreductase (luciferase family)
MNLGFFTMPLHRPEKTWSQALAEDREAILLAEQLGYTEAWVGEHFSTKAEQIPSPMMFLATLIHGTRKIRLGTGVVNLPHHHPVVVAAEAALFDQLSGGRLMLGVGPGGLMSDGELFGREDMAERYRLTMESLDIILQLWRQDAPIHIDGQHWDIRMQREIWPQAGVGQFPKPLQTPHPPIAMAMVGPGGPTAALIAERDFIPLSANFVPVENIEGQQKAYAEARDRLGRPLNLDVWRVCRNILVTGSDAHADELLRDPDGTLAFYFRYLRGVRRIGELEDRQHASPESLNAFLEVDQALEECVIAGSVKTVRDRIIALVDRLGAFGTLVSVGHDWDESHVWQDSMRMLAVDVMPVVSQHADAVAR